MGKKPDKAKKSEKKEKLEKEEKKQKKSEKKSQKKPLKAKSAKAKRSLVTPEKRIEMVATAAYYIAERHGFNPERADQDWREAERQIDAEMGDA